MPKRRSLALSTASVPKAFRKSQRKPNGNKVRKMLAAMDQQARQRAGQADSSATTPDNEEFFSTGRTGRRNALPDILGEHAHVTSSDLPAKLQALSTSEVDKGASGSAAPEPGPSCSSTDKS